MNIRLFSAGRHARKRKKFVSLTAAVAMVASVICAVFFATVQSASAAVDDFRPANWNMQGGQGTLDSKWGSGVHGLMQQNHDVIALQETGEPPASAGRWDSNLNQMVMREANGARAVAHDFGAFHLGLRGRSATGQNLGWTVQRYDYRPGGARLGTWNIYYMQTDFGNANGQGRVNLAIVSRQRADFVSVARPAFTNRYGFASSRPSLGIQIGDTWFWTVHALSGGGNDARQLLENIDTASGNDHWAALGDFNREPRLLSTAQNMHIYRTGRATHYGGNGNDNELDYMVANQVVPGLSSGSRDLSSDHRAVFYFRLMARADVQIFIPYDDEQTLGTGGEIVDGGETVIDRPSTQQTSDVHWHLEESGYQPGYYMIENNLTNPYGTKSCWNATHEQLIVTPCKPDQSPYWFKLDYWKDTGQVRIQPYGKNTCVGDGDDFGDFGVYTPAFTTSNCKNSSARLNFRYDRDPGAGAMPFVAVNFMAISNSPSPSLTVAADGSAQYRTVQNAINAVPADGNPHTILINKGTYNEVVTVPKTLTNLTIKGATGNAADVVIKYDRCHGCLKPDGTQYGTEGSAVASFKAPNLAVQSLTIQNTFDPAAHPEISPYETQAVALAATGDRQVYTNVRIISTQDTVLAKSPVATDQTRQYFRNVYIAGSIDFLFGNATAVFDQATLHVWPHVGGTIVAPNTDQARKYGLLITNSKVISSSAANTFYLGRPWHNTTTASPQAVIRDTELPAGITTAQPWTNMVPDYTWQQARFFEYHNSGAGAGVNSKRPQLTDAQAKDYTAQKYLAGTDGWNPVQ